MYEVHPKSNGKMWLKRGWLHIGGYFFLNFSRHPLLIWLHCFFHRCKTLKAVATATAAIVLLTPAKFYHFRRPKFNFSLSPSLLRPLAKNLQKQKLLPGSMWRKSMQKNRKKALKSPAVKRQRFFTKICHNGKSRQFFGRCWGFAEMLWVKISS